MTRWIVVLSTIHERVKRAGDQVKISELSRQSGTPIPTIKYYIREKLLPSGTTTARNQAKYDDRHVARLELIRSLREVAHLGIPTVGTILDAVDHASPTRAAAPHLAIALRALSPELIVPRGMERAYREAEKKVDALVGQRGWRITGDSAGRADLIRALVGIERYWPAHIPYPKLTDYSRIAERIAHLEIPDDWNPASAPAETLRYAVLGTILFEPLLLALRRMAHADRSRRLTSAHAKRKADRAGADKRGPRGRSGRGERVAPKKKM